MNLTLVIPVFNERESLRPLVEQIEEHAAAWPHHIILVDDGSTDGSFEVMESLHAEYSAVDLIRLRRNFGKTAALAAGIARAKGDVLVTMDADLQDDPRELPRLLDKLNEGYDLVVGWKRVRHDPWHKTFPSRVYNHMASRLFGLDLHDINCGFKAMRMDVALSLPLYGELHRMISVHAAARGYLVAEVPVEHHPRRFGRSKYGWSRFLRGGMDMLSTWFLLRHGQAPSHVFGKAGCVGVAGGAFFAVLTLVAAGFRLFGLDGASAEMRMGVTMLAFMGLLGALVLFGLAMLVFLGGLIAELTIWRHPPTRPGSYIASETSPPQE
jgi:dolichol-phosphate mannosyltransferase